MSPERIIFVPLRPALVLGILACAIFSAYCLVHSRVIQIVFSEIKFTCACRHSSGCNLAQRSDLAPRPFQRTPLRAELIPKQHAALCASREGQCLGIWKQRPVTCLSLAEMDTLVAPHKLDVFQGLCMNTPCDHPCSVFNAGHTHSRAQSSMLHAIAASEASTSDQDPLVDSTGTRWPAKKQVSFST